MTDVFAQLLIQKGLKNEPLGCRAAWIKRGMLTSHRRKTPADMAAEMEEVSGEGGERGRLEREKW